MEKAKRKKMVIFGSLAGGIVLFISFIFAWNAGLGLPNYNKYNGNDHSLVYPKYRGSTLLYNQFENENKTDKAINRVCFYYNNIKFYLQKDNIRVSDWYYSIYKDSENDFKEVGIFDKQEKEGKYQLTNEYNYVFLMSSFYIMYH